ncbi:hypothetical protein [Arthrobacter monumenti]
MIEEYARHNGHADLLPLRHRGHGLLVVVLLRYPVPFGQSDGAPSGSAQPSSPSQRASPRDYRRHRRAAARATFRFQAMTRYSAVKGLLHA